MRLIFTTILAMIISTGVFAVDGATSTPVPKLSDNQQQLIDQLLTVSGMKSSLQNLSAQTATGFMQAALRSGVNTDEKTELVKTLEKAFQKDVFVNRVNAALKKNYDEKRYTNLLQLLSTPLATRMLKLEIEAQEANPADVQGFLAQVSKHPLESERIKLVQRMDEATQSTELATTMTIASLEAGAIAAGDDCSIVTTKIKKSIEKSRSEIEKANRTRTQILLAFTYRNVSDSDLGAYLKTYEDKDSRWVQKIVLSAIEDQFNSSVEKGMQGIRTIIQAHKSKKTMFAPKCGQSESPREEEPVIDQKPNDKPSTRGASPADKTAPVDNPATGQSTSRQADEKASASDNKISEVGKLADKARSPSVRGRDLRYCLDLATSAEVIACANK